MIFDLNPMQATASPVALLAGQTGATAPDEFAALLDRGTPVEQVDGQAMPAPGGRPEARTPIELPPATTEAVPTPIEASRAIAYADALVATLAPAPKPVESPATIPATAPVVAAPAAIRAPAPPSILARPAARREAPTSLPMEQPDEDLPESRKEADDGTIAAPAILAFSEAPRTQHSPEVLMEQHLPETPSALPSPLTPNAQRPVAAAAPSLAPDSGASAERAVAPTLVADHIKLPERAAHEEHSPVPVVEPEAAHPARAEAKPAPAEAVLPERTHHVEVARTMQPQTGAVPKAAPVRASKIAEVAVGLANALPDPSTTLAHKPLPDVVVRAPAAAEGLITAPGPKNDIIVDRQLDLVRNEQWLGELAHDIASTSGDNNRLSFRLMPHQLGRLDVDVARSHDGLSLTIRTENDTAQAILAAAQPRLADEIRAQGLKLADTQLFSGDARHSHSQDSHARAAALIETFTTLTETVEVPEPEQRDGRYA